MDLFVRSLPGAVAVLATMALLGACDDQGPSEEPDPCADDGECDPSEDPSGDGFVGCGEETTTVITELSAVLPGFEQSPADLLASIEVESSGEFVWRPNDGPITVAHAGQTSSFEMSVDHDGGEVRLIEVELAGSFPDGQEGGQPCANRLEIDTTISFATDDGLFAETWNATVDHSPSVDGWPEGSGVRLYRPIDFSAHKGTLAASDFAFEGADFTDAIVTAQLEDGKVSGGLLMEVRQAGMGDSGWIGAGDVASFESAVPE